MSDQAESIFTENKEVQTPVQKQETSAATTSTPSQPNPLEDLLKEIKNEKGEQKYKSLEDALNGLKHAQEYIPKIKQEKTESELRIEQMEAELNRLRSLEETVFDLTQKQVETQTAGVPVSEEELAKIVESTLTKREREALYAKNQKTVASILMEKFGEDAPKVFYDKAKEMDLTVEEINMLAAKTPKAVLTLLGVSETDAHKQSSMSPSRGSLNSSEFQQTPATFLGRETKGVMLGATTEDLRSAVDNAAKLAEELRNQGLSTYDLTDPKVFNKYIK